MNIKKELETKIGIANDVYLNNIEIDPLTIKAIMINEVVPADPAQDFYGLSENDNSPFAGSRGRCCFHTGCFANGHLHHKRRKNPKNGIYH